MCRGQRCAVDHKTGVSDFAGMMGRLTKHPHQLQLFVDVWWDLRDAYVLNGDWSDSSHSLHDILKFWCCFMRHERFNKRYSHGRHTIALIDASRAAFMTWLGDRTDKYVLTIYHAEHPIVHRAPPALTQTQGAARRRTEVQPEAIWDMIAKAKYARANIQQAIALKSDEAAFILRILIFEPVLDFCFFIFDFQSLMF